MTTVYFAGTEDVSFLLSGSMVGNVTSAAFRAAFSRANLFANAGTTTAAPPATAASTGNVGALTSFWVHGMISNGGNNATLAAANTFYIEDSGGVGRILVTGTGTAGQLRISTRNAAGGITTLVTSAAGAYPASTTGVPVALDLFVNYAVSGQATLYVNGVAVADTGPGVNVTTDSATALAAVLFGAPVSSANIFWSECLVQDTTTLGCGVQTLPPLAAGNTQSWTPNTLANINPTVINDANFISSATANQVSQWTNATTLPTGSWTINAVVQSARVSVGTSGPLHFEWNVRTSDGTDHVTGSVAPLTSFGNFNNVWPVNPHTGVAWNAAELINFGLESLT